MEKRERKPRGFWTKEQCYEAARECKTRKEFAENCRSGYYVAVRNKWIKDMFPERCKKRLDEMFPEGEKNEQEEYWTKAKCYEIAYNYNTCEKFKRNCKKGYEVALRNGWLGEFWWFERQQNPFTDKMDNVYCYYFTEFNSVYVGRTIHPQKRDYQHRSSGTVYRFTRKNKIELPEMVLLETNLSLEEGLELEDYYVNKFKKEGWRVLNKAKTGKGCGGLGCLRSSKWTKEECFRAAQEYGSRTEFCKNCGSGYQTALKNKWLDELFPKTKKQRKTKTF